MKIVLIVLVLELIVGCGGNSNEEEMRDGGIDVVTIDVRIDTEPCVKDCRVFCGECKDFPPNCAAWGPYSCEMGACNCRCTKFTDSTPPSLVYTSLGNGYCKN